MLIYMEYIVIKHKHTQRAHSVRVRLNSHIEKNKLGYLFKLVKLTTSKKG